MEASRRIADHHIGAARLGRRNRIVYNGGGIGTLGMFHDLTAAAFRPDLQLLNRRCTEGIRRCQQDFLPLLAQAGSDLSNGGGLSHAVHADHQDDRGLCADMQLLIAGDHLRHRLPQHLKDLGRVGNPLCLYALFHLFANALGGRDARIRHDEQLFQLLKEGFIDFRIGTEHIVQRSAEALPGLFQSFFNFRKQTHVVDTCLFEIFQRSKPPILRHPSLVFVRFHLPAAPKAWKRLHPAW